jgi:multiple sugar transport system permease protein
MVRKRTFPGMVGTLVTLTVAGLWMFPLFWALTTSLRQEMQTLANPPLWLPNPITFDAYSFVLRNSALPRWYFNSIVVAVVVTSLVILLCMLCAYALSQLHFPGRDVLFWVFLAAFMVPGEARIVPLFMLMNELNLVNTFAGIILPQLIAVVTIAVFKQFFDAVPGEMRDAAVIDGANDFRILFNIYLPMNWGITWALVIVNFITSWNAFFWPFIITTSTDMMTIPIGITQVQEAYGIAFARQMAVAVLAGLPIGVAYLIFQRRVTEGIMMTSGLKG